MSLSSAATTDDAEGDEGSSRGFSSLPSTSESSTNAPTSQSGRYPESLSATGAAHKSAKLETFDELLREAGYQHTRVLTPKGERVGKDDATYSASAGSGEHSQGLGEIKSYVMTVTGLLAWLGGRSTTATTDPAMEASESTPDNAYKGNRSAIDPHDARLSRSPSPTSHRNRNSAQRLLPSINHIPSSPTSSSNHVSHQPYLRVAGLTFCSEPKLSLTCLFACHFHIRSLFRSCPLCSFCLLRPPTSP